MSAEVPHDVASSAAHLRDFAAGPLRKLPLYRYLADRAGQDREVAERLLLASPPVRWATLLMASVHDVLLETHRRTGDADAAAAEEPLCGWYRSITDRPRPLGAGADDPWPHFRRIALESAAVTSHLSSRGTQTNEVGRSATTVLALGGIQRDVDAPLGLVEVGASAGLNLRVDAYRYSYEPAGATDQVEGTSRLDLGRRDDGLLLRSTWRGDTQPPVPAEVPVIASRIGIDLQPVDVRDDQAARWLIACQWPEQAERLDRCRRAVTEARLDPPHLIAGNLLEEVASLVRSVRAGAHPVVLSTWCLAYLDVADQRLFMARLDEVGAERDLTLIFQEQPVAVPGLDPPPRPDGGGEVEPTALCRIDWRYGRRSSAVRLADQHPHGTWSHWFR